MLCWRREHRKWKRYWSCGGFGGWGVGFALGDCVVSHWYSNFQIRWKNITSALNSFRAEGPPPDGFFSASLRKSRRLCRRYTQGMFIDHGKESRPRWAD